MSDFTPCSIVQAAREQIWCDLHGEAVILNPQSEKYYGVNCVGESIWKLLQEPRRVNDIGQALCTEYEVEPACCQRDLLTFLHNLALEGLLEVSREVPS